MQFSPAMLQRSDLRVVCVSKRYAHHSTSSGYDQLAHHVGAVRVGGPSLESIGGRLAEKGWEVRNRGRLRNDNYRFADRIAAEAAFWTAWRCGAQIVHALYGEEQIHALLPRIPLLRAHLVATFHYPIGKIRDVFADVPDRVMRQLSGLVMVGSRDVAAAEAWLGLGKVAAVPLGVDTGAFHPGVRQPVKTARFAFVGWHMRDFEIAHAAIDLCATAGLDAHFDIVVRRDKYAFFTGCQNVTCHSDLSEAELRRLYQDADALFLPLTDTTANTAVTESLACGTPVITSDIGSIRDYMDESCGWLLPPRDPVAAFARLSAIVADRALAESRRPAARARAERLAWPVVAPQIMQCYTRLVTTGQFGVTPERVPDSDSA